MTREDKRQIYFLIWLLVMFILTFVNGYNLGAIRANEKTIRWLEGEINAKLPMLR